MIAPKPYVSKTCKKRICVVDTETDPFEVGLIVKPFSLGFYDGEIYREFWGDNCVAQYFEWLCCYEEPLLIYAHNGGNFDFYFFMEFWDKWHNPFIVDGRIVQTYFAGQEYRDSFKIIPVALGTYEKDTIDYAKMKRKVREQHKAEILKYMKKDCTALYDLVAAYHEEFGDKLTIGSTALPQLHARHGYEQLKPVDDACIRSYYYGGRVQCFETGVITGNFQVYDVNSMYPYVMKTMEHPVGNKFDLSQKIGPHTQFAYVEADNYGAFCARTETGGLTFAEGRGRFYATIHEINAALDTGTARIVRVLHAYDCVTTATFDDFVDHFYLSRLRAKAAGDKIRDLFYKLILNSAYGKFAQDPTDFEEYCVTDGQIPEGEGWEVATIMDETFIWRRPSRSRFSGFKNVATAASITGAARSILLRGIAASRRPIYCDTDSLVCEALDARLDDKELGAWKHEATADRVAIAGKKLYALYNGNELVKKACKGGKLSGPEIVRVAQGDQVEYANPVPKFKLDGSTMFVTRTFKQTARV